MATQWRIGPGGRTGLDYSALPAVMDMMDIKHKRRPDVFAGVQTMEREALRIWADKR